MPKYRIVQGKPIGFPDAFSIDELVDIPATKSVNPKYNANRNYWESTFRLNAASMPSDWWVVQPETELWKHIAGSECATQQLAEAKIKQIKDLEKLKTNLKTFKRVVIKEYD